MNSSDAFFADTAETYRDFMRIVLLETENFGEAAKNHVIALFKNFSPLLAVRVLKAFKKIQAVEATNPLALDYFSISPFQHGHDRHSPLVKYALFPCEGTWTESVDKSNPNFLRSNLTNYIQSKPACYRFMVQDYHGSFSVEDLTRPWDPAASPFTQLAIIEFPAQELMDEIEAEKLVINPWNTLPEHKPVGGINRLRLAAYLLSIEMRKRTNKF